MGAIAAHSEDAVTSGDLAGRLTGWNVGAERLYGYPAQEAVGRHVSEVMRPLGGADVVARNVARLRRGERVAPFEAVHRTRDGRPLRVSVELSPITDAAGEVVGVLAINRDVTALEKAEEALGEGEARLFRYMVRNSSDLITLVGAEGTIRYASPALGRILGYGPEERAGGSIFDLLHPEDVAGTRELFAEGLRRPGVPLKIEVRQRHKDGSWRHVEVTGTNLLDDPSTGAVVLSSRDVTDRKRAEEALRESEARFRAIFEQSSDALLVHDGAGMMVDCNPEACRSLGYSREELLSLSVEDFGLKLVSDEEGLDRDGMLWERVMDADPGEVAGVVLGMHRRKDGTTFPVEVRLSGVDYGGRRLILASCRDLTERRAMEGRLAHMAFHDSLTGLPNRALFKERLSRTLGRADRDGEPVCLLFLDLDGFKEVNDRHGHEAGDALLAAAAGRIGRCLRPSDTAARMGGDEFAVLLEGLGPERAREVATRIGEALGAPFAVGGEEARVGASVGVACAVPGQKDAAELLGEADREMYRAKKRGRGYERIRRRKD